MDSSRKVKQGGPGSIVRALSYRNYRLFFMGQSVSLIGSWMQTIATSWLAYKLTGSAFLLGMVSFSAQIPTFFFAPVAGVLLDRWNRRKVLIVTQTLMMLQAFLLALLTLSGIITVWHIIALNVAVGFIAAFDMPGRQIFVNDVVERKEDLGNAIALNSSLFNGARMIGPTIAGIIIARAGEGMCFLFNGLSFLGVLAALIMIRTVQAGRRKEKTVIIDELREGIEYAWGFRPIRSILFLLFVVSMMGMPAMVLLPVICTKVLTGGPSTMGFLMAATGAGAITGAFYLASRRSVVGLGRVITGAAFLFGAGLVGFSLSMSLWLSLAMVFFTGLGMMVQMASSNTLLQTIVEEEKRGRVMSLYTTVFMGAAPLGSLMAGALADMMGASLTVMIGGVVCLGAAFLFARGLPHLRTMLHPVYRSMGLIGDDRPLSPERGESSGVS